MALRATLTKLAPAAGNQSLFETASKWAMNASGYRKYGLRREDLIMEELPGVKEAIARLPQEEQDARYFRLKRAMNASLKQSYLPKEEWTTDETDVSYLKSVIERVQKEAAERKAWDTQS